MRTTSLPTLERQPARLLAETSCEQRNDFLDRALVVPTVSLAGAAFFNAAHLNP